jgi:P27 family predicted phage terminase small subunit
MMKPPRHLRPATRRWWQAVVNDWELEEHHVRLLTLAAEAYDRCQAARARIDRDGMIVPTKRGGPRAHPLIKVEEAARVQFARLLRELDLDVIAPPAERTRPPALRSIAR